MGSQGLKRLGGAQILWLILWCTKTIELYHARLKELNLTGAPHFMCKNELLALFLGSNGFMGVRNAHIIVNKKVSIWIIVGLKKASLRAQQELDMDSKALIPNVEARIF